MKTNLTKTASAFLMGIALLATSCEDPVSQPEVDPVFPESVTETIEQGGSCEIPLSANMDWELVLSGDLQYFTMTYNGEPATTISGKEGEFTVTVAAVKDESDFEQRKVTLTMKMKDTEQVVAEVHRNGSERIFNVYPVKMDEDGFVSDSEGYVFEDANNNITLYFDGNMFQTYIKVNANFDWALKTVPEWVEINEVEGKYVSSAKANVDGIISLRGVAGKYVLDGEDGKLEFIIDDNSENPVAVEQEVVLTQPAVRDIFVAPASLASQIKFNAAGQYYNPMNGEYQERPMTAVDVTGIAGLQAYAIEVNAMGGLSVVGSTDKKVTPASEWVHFELNDETPENVLKTYGFSITVDANPTSVARRAGLLLIPGAVAIKGEDDLFNDTSDDINPKYSEYMSWFIEQEGKNGGSGLEGGIISADNEQLANKGARLDKITPDSEENAWIPTADEIFTVGTDNYCQLTVTRPKGSYAFSYSPEVEIWGYAVYEYGENGLVPSENTWAQFETMDETAHTLTFSIENDWEPYSMRFIVLHGENGNLAVIFVCYAPEQVIGNGDLISLEKPNDGVINKMDETAPGYGYLVSEYGCKEIYELTWKGNMIYLSTAFDYENRETDEDSAEWLQCYAGGEGRIMVMGFSSAVTKGFVFFKDANGVVVAILVCTMDPNWSAGGEGGEAAVTVNEAVFAGSGAKFGKLKDNMNYADMLPSLQDVFGLDENNFYLLTVPQAEGLYGGFTYSQMVSWWELKEGDLSESSAEWASISEEGISVKFGQDEWGPKFIVLHGWNEATEDTPVFAVICVSLE